MLLFHEAREERPDIRSHGQRWVESLYPLDVRRVTEKNRKTCNGRYSKICRDFRRPSGRGKSQVIGHILIASRLTVTKRRILMDRFVVVLSDASKTVYNDLVFSGGTFSLTRGRLGFDRVT